MTSRPQISPPALGNRSKLKSPRRKNPPRALQRLELAPRCRLISATKALKKSAWKKFSAPEPARRPHPLKLRPTLPKSSIKHIRAVSSQPSAFTGPGGTSLLGMNVASAPKGRHINSPGRESWVDRAKIKSRKGRHL